MRTYIVSGDIAKGALWFQQLSGFLDQASAALVCLTQEALRSPWVHYEVGAIANALTEKRGRARAHSGLAPIFTLLLGVKPGELDGPLAAFQSTSIEDEKDTRRLISDLLLMLHKDDQPGSLSNDWPNSWQQLRNRLERIAIQDLLEVFPDFDKLFRRKTFQESTFECVSQNWLARYDGVRDTYTKLQRMEGAVEWSCRPYAVDMYKSLVAEVDRYAMASSLLTGAKKFEINELGKVVFEAAEIGIARACESSRKRIKSLVARLTDPNQAPHFEEAFRFEEAESVSEKKSLIQRKAPRANADHTIFNPENEDWGRSDWDYDRIIYSLYLEQSVRASKANLSGVLSAALDHAMADMEKVRARQGTDTSLDGSYLMSLSYALGPFECVPPRATSLEAPELLEYLVGSCKKLLARDRKIREDHRESSARGVPGSYAARYETITAVIMDSLCRIERIFGLAETGTAATAG